MIKNTFLLATLLVGMSACAHVPPAQPVDSVNSVREKLGPLVSPVFQNEIMVLGTLHLAGNKQLTPAHLTSTLQALGRFRPTAIGVEMLVADEVAMLEEHATHDAAAAEVLNMFGPRTISLGKLARAETGSNRIEARVAANDLMQRAPDFSVKERQKLVLLLLAAYEYPSALLQWSYLSPLERADPGLPAGIQTPLNKALASTNELSTVALPLARELGLQRLYAIDSQYDGTRTMTMPRAALEDLFSHPSRGNWRKLEMSVQDEARRGDAFNRNDLLPYLRWLNSPEYLAHDVLQWQWLFEIHHESGLDRFRYAMWELRNQRIAANIIDATASIKPERVLVIIGNAHKPYLDTALSGLVTVKLRQLEEFAGESENAY